MRFRGCLGSNSILWTLTLAVSVSISGCSRLANSGLFASARPICSSYSSPLCVGMRAGATCGANSPTATCAVFDAPTSTCNCAGAGHVEMAKGATTEAAPAR